MNSIVDLLGAFFYQELPRVYEHLLTNVIVGGGGGTMTFPGARYHTNSNNTPLCLFLQTKEEGKYME